MSEYDTGSLGEPLTWPDYTAGFSRLFDGLVNIREFALFANIPPLYEIADQTFGLRLAAELYQPVISAISQARFFHEDELKIDASNSQASVIYNDDRYDFVLTVHATQIQLKRSGSKFGDFHAWYSRIAKEFPTMIGAVLEVLRKLTEREFRVHRAGFIFKFLLHDLTSSETGRDVRNSEVMSQLVKGLPSDDGTLSNDSQIFGSAARVDVTSSRWVKVRDSWRNERYDIQAPANKDGAGLWLEFSYLGDTYTEPTTQERSVFSYTSFLDEYDVAYVDFLRDKAIGGFLSSLMRTYDFRSSAGNLP